MDMPTPSPINLDSVNQELGNHPQKLIEWACSLGQKTIATSNFGPFAAVLLHMLVKADPDIPVIWMDSGYNTEATYRFAEDLTRLLRLDLHVYVPRRSRAQRDALNGGVPTPDDPRHAQFTREVKLEPFERAMRDMQPRVWFTGIRKEQTAFRAGLKPATISSAGVLKVAPLFNWSARQMNDYLKAHKLPNNFDYYDPTKVDDKRECGLHIAH
jgi:phosphoadenosine phosphosulfate reductase